MLDPTSTEAIPFQIPVEQREARGWYTRSWVSCGVELTQVPDPAYPYRREILERVQKEFDPSVRAIFVRRAYRSQTGVIRVAGFHALASTLWNPFSRPADWTRKVFTRGIGPIWHPSYMLFHVEDRKARLGDGLPGGFLDFNERIYRSLRGLFQEWTNTEKQFFIDSKAAEAEIAREAAEREAEYRMKTSWPVARKFLANITRRDAADVAEAMKRKNVVITVPHAIEASLSR